MSAGAWTAVASAVATAGVIASALGAWFIARSGRTASPYDVLAKRVTVLEQQRGEDMALIASQQTEIVGLQRRVAGMIDDRDSLVTYIVVVRNWVAGGSRPPPPAIPRHLADVLPEWELDDTHVAALITQKAEESQ